MATPQPSASWPPTGDLAVDGMIGPRWILDAERAIDWSLSVGPEYDRWQDSMLTPAAMQRAFNAVSSVADVAFNYLGGDFRSSTGAYEAGSEINVSLDYARHIEVSEWMLVHQPILGSFSEMAGDIYLNRHHLSYATTLEPGSPTFAVLLQAVGTAVGVSPYPMISTLKVGEFDKDWLSVMAYERMAQAPAASFMPLDIIALQHAYGTNTRTHAGDSLHDLGLAGVHVTLWDAGGTDTLSFAGVSEGFAVRLPYLTLSTLVNTRTGLARPIDEAGAEKPSTLVWLMGELENVTGGAFADSIVGNDLANALKGGGGNDSLEGGAGLDFIRGEAGDDVIAGGDGFDDTHGNMGADTVHGNLGGDWVVGGQGNDLLFGDQDHDIVYGNMGDDTVNGGDGADTVRGGQHDDILSGGGGDDFLSGDRGADTVTGGAGADTFNFFAGAEADRVLDFRSAEGDRVRVEPGAAYTVAQVGADTVVSIGADQMTLVEVRLSSLPSDWLFVG